jgi:glycogen operon protein
MTLSKTVQETQNDANDVTPNSTAGVNYWGYATLNYFALDRRYSSERSPGPTREFKAMVKALHDLAVEVFIDEVYNHTGEGEAWNSADKTIYNLYSFRGLDNRTYYSLTADMQFSWDNTGVGGNFNTYNTIAQDLIVDLLAYWRDAIGIDGFRFDLASALGNTRQDGCFNFDKLDPNNALNRIVRELRPRPATGGEGVELNHGQSAATPTRSAAFRLVGRNGMAFTATTCARRKTSWGSSRSRSLRWQRGFRFGRPLPG